MKVLLLNQAFHPDVVSTAQHLAGLAEELARRGDDVTVVCGDHGYDDPSRRFPREERIGGVRVLRVPYGGMGKRSKWTRAADFATFHASLAARVAFLPRQNAVVALTSPPLISVPAWIFRRLRAGRFVSWVMDLNPDEAIAAGWLDERSLAARALTALNGRSLRAADRVVALDRFMAERLAHRYRVDKARVTVLPPWAHDDQLPPVPHERNPFRRAHGMEGKFVVMYSGNHSPCHPLDTLLETAGRLAADRGVLFCFVGGGSLVARVSEFAASNRLANVLQLPYQPLERLAESLSAADLHVAVMGEPFVGILHPCKVYGILAVGRPFAFVGPARSHLGELCAETGLGRQVEHGDVEGLVAAIAEARAFGPEERASVERRSRELVAGRFSRARLCPTLADLVQGKTP